jgi:hypothetical protein
MIVAKGSVDYLSTCPLVWLFVSSNVDAFPNYFSIFAAWEMLNFGENAPKSDGEVASGARWGGLGIVNFHFFPHKAGKEAALKTKMR